MKARIKPMMIHNIKEIYDNGESITIVTATGTAIHLPAGMEHSITIQMNEGSYSINVAISFDQ